MLETDRQEIQTYLGRISRGENQQKLKPGQIDRLFDNLKVFPENIQKKLDELIEKAQAEDKGKSFYEAGGWEKWKADLETDIYNLFMNDSGNHLDPSLKGSLNTLGLSFNNPATEDNLTTRVLSSYMFKCLSYVVAELGKKSLVIYDTHNEGKETKDEFLSLSDTIKKQPRDEYKHLFTCNLVLRKALEKLPAEVEGIIKTFRENFTNYELAVGDTREQFLNDMQELADNLADTSGKSFSQLVKTIGDAQEEIQKMFKLAGQSTNKDYELVRQFDAAVKHAAEALSIPTEVSISKEVTNQQTTSALPDFNPFHKAKHKAAVTPSGKTPDAIELGSKTAVSLDDEKPAAQTVVTPRSP